MRGVIIYLIICTTLIGCVLRGQENTFNKLNKNPHILFAVTGYGSPDTSISMNNLIKRISTDSINSFISAEIRIILDSILHIPTRAISVRNWDEVPSSDSVLYITDLPNLLPEMKVLRIENIDFFDDPENYSFTTSNKFAKQVRDSITYIIVSGVTAITRAAGVTADSYGIDFLTQNLKPYFTKADFVHISNEVSISPNCQYTTGMSFCTKEEHFKALLDLNCNIVELTGNHNLDYGDAAYLETLKWYRDHNIKTFGGGDNPDAANTPLILTLKDSTKIGFIGFNEFCPNGECADSPGECGANRYDSAKAAAVISKMKNEMNCSVIIASVQFGEWDYPFPHFSQKKICSDLIKIGADMVYGSQAHEVQQITFINHKPVFYGLGNLLFDQIHRTPVRQAFFLQLYFYKGMLIQARPVFTFMQLNRQQNIASAEEAEEIRKSVFQNILLYPDK